ncbi:MAG: hypothetical protein JSV67_04590 [Thermoplasmatales archaeon]|nr:MAG: hypothetical protein JSV67_04590 [Thermoplasmatales archaeon]
MINPIRKKFVSILFLFFIVIIYMLTVCQVSGMNLYNNVYSQNNSPPNPPEITGVTIGKTGEIYNYSIVSIDPDGDDVSYYIEFGTGDFIITYDWYPSGEPINVSYTWIEIGSFIMRARAQDFYGAQSDWGTLEVIISGDERAPEITILKPENALYIMDFKIRKFLFRKSLIIGSINIEVNAFDEDSGINRVEFFIDGELKANITTPPYKFKWNREKFSLTKHRHSIKVIAFDNFGNSNSDEIIVWKFL